MQPRSPKLLEDVRRSAAFIVDITRGKTVDGYLADPILRAAVERHFEIIGEALSKLTKHDPETVAPITDHQRIIAFRNILIHGYDAIDNRRVWDAVENSLPPLLQQTMQLLAAAPPPDSTSA